VNKLGQNLAMKTPKIQDVAAYLESIAPRSYQESYDNAGLIVGDPDAEVTGVLVTLDCTEAVVQEAIDRQCNLIVAHHPIVFKGLKRLTGQTYVERVVMLALRNQVAIYAAHTNLDNVYHGVNQKIAEKLGLRQTRILAPKAGTLSKLETFVPQEQADKVLDALYAAGAGQVGAYKNCSFSVSGTGRFEPTAGTKPHIGQAGKAEAVSERRIEVLLPTHLESKVLAALRSAHPYEEAAYYLTRLENQNQEVGAGMIGELDAAIEPLAFLRRLKEQMHVSVVRHTAMSHHPIKRVAVCGGAGSFLLQDAIRQGADAFVSGDFKYHEFFDAEQKILIADIGHYESEQFTKDLFVEVLTKKFATFAINFSKTDTNPIFYL
jgi:dinuclear metal center YbgI/SA1388 family protein